MLSSASLDNWFRQFGDRIATISGEIYTENQKSPSGHASRGDGALAARSTCDRQEEESRRRKAGEVSVTPKSIAIATGQSTQFTAHCIGNGSGAPIIWEVNGIPNGDSTFGTIDDNGLYTAPSGSQSGTAKIAAVDELEPSKFGEATVDFIAPGQVAAMDNPQVALYTISPPREATVFVEFGTDPDYELRTWDQSAPANGGAVSVFVAGMRADMLYHMRAVVRFSDGPGFVDSDHVFTTGGVLATFPSLNVTTTGGMRPQPSVEILDLFYGPSTVTPVAIADLSGNVLCGYNPGLPGLIANPVKLLPNGHFLINFSGQPTDGIRSVLQEIDLSGQLVWQMTAADLNNALGASCANMGIGCSLTVTGTHYDFVILPSRHLIVIAGTQQVISGTTVTGDVIIDLDQNHTPVWLWNEFDHLDINRRPMGYPDWTHTNAVIYSADDGNLIVSIRHQNWLVKVDYANGTGTGSILWKLGSQGDFALLGGTDPTDWFYAQHGPSFVSTNTTGQFSLILFDNGDDRVFPAGLACGAMGAPPCLYSTVPLLQVDEAAKTATLMLHLAAPTYSSFGGNAAVLQNGNVEYCEAAGGPGLAGDIYEVTRSNSPPIVWKMLITGQFAYRGQRIPSLYPGVQW